MSDTPDRLDALIQKRMPEYLTNSGHGHVWRRPDGMRARCGGPALCVGCVLDKSRLEIARNAVAEANS